MDPFDLRQWPNFVKAGGDSSLPAVIDHVIIDSRRVQGHNALFFALKGINEDGHDYVISADQAGAKYAIVKNGWQPPADLKHIQLLFVDDPLDALQQIAGCYRSQLTLPIIAIGGSYGKTMVKDLLLSILSTKMSAAGSPESFNSQIGVPLSLFTLNQDHEIGIIEASSSLPDEMDNLISMIRPDYVIITPIGKKHLTTFGNLQKAASETMKLAFAVPKDHWVMMPQDQLLAPYIDQIKSSIYFWNQDDPSLPYSTILGNDLSDTVPYRLQFPDGKTFNGRITAGYAYFTNLINIASIAAWLLGISSDDISLVLNEYIPEPMRTEIWKSSIGTTFINDVYCSDPQSIDLSLRHFQLMQPNQKRVFIFGGMRSQKTSLEVDYKRIGQSLGRSKLDRLVLFGKHDFSSLIQEVQKIHPQTEISIFKNYQETLDQMRETVSPHDLIVIKGEKKEPLTTLTEAFNDSHSHNQCLINLAAINNNLSIIRNALNPKTRLMVIVKALAYGTDEVRMAKFLSTCGVDILGVSYVDEGIALKRAGVTQSIFSINAAYYEAAKLVKWGLEVGVSDRQVIEAISKAATQQSKKVKVHLHINTGMGRFGCRPEEALELAALVKESPSLILEGLMTHFASADDALDDSFTFSQVACFDGVIKELQENGIEAPWTHAANSSGAIRFNFSQYNMVRIGLAAYGLYASNDTSKALELQLAISLTSRIVGINTCKKGETISYGRTYQAKREWEKIAVLPMGYFDGLHRNYSGKGYVLIRGHRARMVGRICMDFMMVDVTDIPNVAIGDIALIFGEDQFGYYLSPEELAKSGNSIVHELITCLGPRIPRIFVYEEAHQYGTRNSAP